MADDTSEKKVIPNGERQEEFNPSKYEGDKNSQSIGNHVEDPNKPEEGTINT